MGCQVHLHILQVHLKDVPQVCEIVIMLLFTRMSHPSMLHLIGSGLPSLACCTFKSRSKTPDYWYYCHSIPPSYACQGIWHAFHTQDKVLLELQARALQSCAASDSAVMKVPFHTPCKVITYKVEKKVLMGVSFHAPCKFVPASVRSSANTWFSCGKWRHWNWINWLYEKLL